jgi:hypothetical protein
MKKFALLFIVVFAFVIANAQNKETSTQSFPYEGPVPCVDDYVWGVETVTNTYWDSKTQIKWKGEYEGASGKHYTWSLVVNSNWKDYILGQTYIQTYTSTSVIECEGEPVALYKVRYHVTITPDGEVVIERKTDSGAGWICF